MRHEGLTHYPVLWDEALCDANADSPICTDGHSVIDFFRLVPEDASV